jgi:hypothetical protein
MEDMHNRAAGGGGENKWWERKGKIFFYINKVIFTVKEYEIL